VLEDWGAMVRAGTPLPASNPQIQVQMANGSAFTTKKELEHITPQRVDGFFNLVATRAGRLVLTYNATTPTAKRGRPHLSVYLEDGGPLAGNWSLLAQSNFNAPKLSPDDPKCAKARAAAGAATPRWRGPGAGGAGAAAQAAACALGALLLARLPAA
jgi:hypothetical protein